MRKQFSEYFYPDEAKLNEIWQDCIFVFDTNFLLRFFEFTDETNQVILEILRKIKKDIWLPNHVGQEFMQKRFDVISRNITNIEELKNFIMFAKDKFKEQATTVVNKCKLKRFHPNIKIENIFNTILRSFDDSLQDIVDQNKIEEKKQYLDYYNRVFEEMSGIFGDRFAEFNQNEYEKLKKEGLDRAKNKIPPGYKDYENFNHKKENDFINHDFIIWKQTLEQAKKTSKNVIFITDDTKEDWFKTYNKNIVNPNHLLVREFNNSTKKHVIIYTISDFLENLVNIGINVEKKYIEIARDYRIDFEKSQLIKQNELKKVLEDIDSLTKEFNKLKENEMVERVALRRRIELLQSQYDTLKRNDNTAFGVWNSGLVNGSGLLAENVYHGFQSIDSPFWVSSFASINNKPSIDSGIEGYNNLLIDNLKHWGSENNDNDEDDKGDNDES